jgi:hypothetical protein
MGAFSATPKTGLSGGSVPARSAGTAWPPPVARAPPIPCAKDAATDPSVEFCNCKTPKEALIYSIENAPTTLAYSVLL